MVALDFRKKVSFHQHLFMFSWLGLVQPLFLDTSPLVLATHPYFLKTSPGLNVVQSACCSPIGQSSWQTDKLIQRKYTQIGAFETPISATTKCILMMQRARVSKKSMVSRVQFVFTAEAQRCMSLGEGLNLGRHYLLSKGKVPRRWAGILPHTKSVWCEFFLYLQADVVLVDKDGTWTAGR